MARRTAALARAEKALAGARKRASILRTKVRKDQPMEIAMTIGGGALDGFVQLNQPAFLNEIDIDSGIIVGATLVGYGLLSTKDGQLEKASTSIGTGMLAAATSRYVQANM